MTGLFAKLPVARRGVLSMYRALRRGTKYPGDPEPVSRIMRRVARVGLFPTGITIRSTSKSLQ